MKVQPHFLKIIRIQIKHNNEYLIMIKDIIHGVSFWRDFSDVDSLFTLLVAEYIITSNDNSNLEYLKTCSIDEITDSYEYLKLKSLLL